ncbi:MAG: M20/M25/M40 family metallo-hydrolase [Lachnospiraceae bacterium]|nr:M20/M25/M40 family metallo-hydrolase [Lachnospiraceae bacterium]
MADNGVIVNSNRIVEEFSRLVSFDTESFQEKKIAAYLKKRLTDLGLTVTEDNAGETLHTRYPGNTETASNLYAYLRGDTAGEPILFSSHMDTVSPGKGKRAILQEDGRITSAGDTVLGADDVSGLVSILEALTVIREQKLSHPDIEVLFTVAEEPYCEGSKYVEYDRLKAKQGYVLDLTGPVGRAANAAPSILSVKVTVKGKAAHAGFAPEEGINALTIAAKALRQLPAGRVEEDLTVNFGVIRGGAGRNIVPERIELEGEIRSLDHRKALLEAERMQKTFAETASEYGGSVEVKVTEHIRAYHVDAQSPAVKRFEAAVRESGRCSGPECITTYGGSDANRLNEHGIETIVLACAMENCHSTEEYTTIEELSRSAELTLRLMTLT